MVMIKSIVRPEKSKEIMDNLLEAGFPAVTKLPVVGRGKQRGLKVGEVFYDEIPKEMLIVVVKEKDKDLVLSVIMENAKTGDSGNFGDGKIFVYPVEDVYTISSGFKEVEL
ncbi:MAG: P-II family nitrogen regulator [Spirochaetales bacterium]|nr:P-II family nitrogen regulator [Spirochaetales bacterium]